MANPPLGLDKCTIEWSDKITQQYTKKKKVKKQLCVTMKLCSAINLKIMIFMTLIELAELSLSLCVGGTEFTLHQHRDEHL